MRTILPSIDFFDSTKRVTIPNAKVLFLQFAGSSLQRIIHRQGNERLRGLAHSVNTVHEFLRIVIK
jgi:hypothetical protein